MIIISIGDIIGKAFEFAKKYGLPMAAMLFAAGVLCGIISSIPRVGVSQHEGLFQLAVIGPILASSFLQLIISTVVGVSIFASILEILRNNGGRYRFNHGLSPIVYLKVVGCQFVYGLAVYFGLIFLIAPGIFFRRALGIRPDLFDRSSRSRHRRSTACFVGQDCRPLLAAPGLGHRDRPHRRSRFGGLLRGLFLHPDDSLHRTSDHLPSALAGRRGACE